MTVEVVTPEELRKCEEKAPPFRAGRMSTADESTPGVVRRTVFETEKAVMVQSTIAGETTTGWHHHGSRDVYGYVVEGGGAVEYGPDGDETRESSVGEFVYISSGTVHRDMTPAGEETVVLVCFVGSGPVVVNVDGPMQTDVFSG